MEDVYCGCTVGGGVVDMRRGEGTRPRGARSSHDRVILAASLCMTRARATLPFPPHCIICNEWKAMCTAGICLLKAEGETLYVLTVNAEYSNVFFDYDRPWS